MKTHQWLPMIRRLLLCVSLLLSLVTLALPAQAQDTPLIHTTTWMDIGHANDVVAMAQSYNYTLFAATRDNLLWIRDLVEYNVNWRLNGHAINVVAMALIHGWLYAATRDNQLWR